MDPTEATIAFTAAEITNSDCSHGSTTIGMPFGANEVAVSTGDGIVRNPPAGTEERITPWRSTGIHRVLD